MIEYSDEEVTFEGFLQRKQTSTSHSERDKILKKIHDIVKANECFINDNIFPSHFQSAQQPNKDHRHKRGNNHSRHNNGHSHHHAHGISAPVIQRVARSPMKEVQGILNKITLSTYNELLQKVIRCCAYKECSVDVIDAIIKKCYTTGSYTNLYHNLLEEMVSRYPKEVETAIQLFYDDVAQNITSELKLLEEQPNSVRNYEGFCAYVKRKNMLTNKIATLINLAKKSYSSTPTHKAIYDTIVKHVEFIVRKGDSLYYDCLDIVTNIILLYKKEKLITPIQFDDLVFIYNDIRETFPLLPKKIQFTWDEIIFNGGL